jgi:hypothetical protein
LSRDSRCRSASLVTTPTSRNIRGKHEALLRRCAGPGRLVSDGAASLQKMANTILSCAMHLFRIGRAMVPSIPRQNVSRLSSITPVLTERLLLMYENAARSQALIVTAHCLSARP